MKKDWAKDFYKMQYEFIGNYGKDFYEVSAVEILSQIGKPIENLLELGSADGSLSRALSNKVSHITTVELVDNLVEKAKEVNPVNINAINGDFLEIDLQNTYDAIIYIDGFGLGDDSAQLNLLKNIKQWLKKDGCGLIDIYQPEHWKKADKIEMYVDPKNMPNIKRRYTYDYKNDVMIDTWWREGEEETKQSQYLKCYTLKEIKDMFEAAGLQIIEYFTNGAMDYETMTYTEAASLEKCMSYRIKVVRS